MTMCYVIKFYGKLTNKNFDILCKMLSCFGKAASLLVYNLQRESFLYENISMQNFTSNLNHIWSFSEFLDSQKSIRR
jgi:hypothetical protein